MERCPQNTVPRDVIEDIAVRFNINYTWYADGCLGFENEDIMKLLVHIATLERALFKGDK